MSPAETVDPMACSRFGANVPPVVQQPRRHLTKGLGYFFLFVAAVIFLTINNAFLRTMASEINEQQQAAEEAKKPAEVETIAIISPNCSACYNIMGLITNLNTNKNIKITNTQTIEVGSTAGVAIVNQYALTRSPAFIIKGQTEKLLAAVPGLKSFGELQGDVFVGSKIPAPYADLMDGKIRGEFAATYITEKGCKECYDPTINKQALQQLGMIPTTEKTVDRLDPEGRELVKKYKLTTSPTIILTGDLAAYEGFDKIWQPNVGTIEPDGAYVFRSAQERMGTYYDLMAKKIITPPPAKTNTSTP